MFTLPDVDKVIYLQGHYSIPIVLLSIVIACLAAFTALSMHERMKSNSFVPRYVWLTLASVSMGFGIWSMHFIGMSAYMLPVKMEFNKLLTVISVLPAMIASFLAFYITGLPKQSIRTYSISGIVMGLGISTMHYVGMMAMVMEVNYAYHIGYFILSIIIAIVVSFVSLYIFGSLYKYMKNVIYKVVTAIIMGMAVASMHYTGMYAVRYYVVSTINITEQYMHHMNMNFFTTIVTLGIVIILVTSIVSSLIDRYVDYRINYFDVLTKLPNRRQFEKALKINGFSKQLAILHIHDMGKWNTMYNYSFGDKVIQYISSLCERLKPVGIELYRIEGNRFAFVANHDASKDLLTELRNISTILSKPISIDDQLVTVKTVTALSTSKEKNNGKKIYAQALAVLHHHATLFEHTIIAFDPAVHIQSMENQLVQDVDHAMAENDFFVVYQPKVAVYNKGISGVEALLRWHHPIHGLLSPGVFIPVLEKSGKMNDVTDWIINEVCKQIITWKNEGMDMQVSINIPGPYVTSPRLLSFLQASIMNYGIKAERLELEMTETSAVANIEGAIESVQEFRNCGFSVALDDFGTGVSSLSYLKRLPVSTLKIDKSFVDGVPHSEKDSEIMKAIVALGHSLDLNIVIEGVEDKEQVEFLASVSGRDINIQGFYYAKPMKPEELKAWIESKVEGKQLENGKKNTAIL
ncbi:bifunctional diguanylate cyclase/phosphodiesterase [Niallia sp. 01092]|uniref:bifunctional diguanylate cyclase/phosphodiesterase n=1 Tax=unclassified Niallia TaxID=2837522 RepID=UPI003FD23B50